MGHPVEYDSGSSLAIFLLRISFFLFLAFHHFFTIFLKVFSFFLSFNRNTYAMTSNFFLFPTVSITVFKQSVSISQGVAAVCICVATPITQFSKIVSIEGRFCSSFTILSSCFVFSLGACFRGFECVPFSESYLISSRVVVIKS